MGAKAVEATVNRYPEQYGNTRRKYDAGMIEYLISDVYSSTARRNSLPDTGQDTKPLSKSGRWSAEPASASTRMTRRLSIDVAFLAAVSGDRGVHYPWMEVKGYRTTSRDHEEKRWNNAETIANSSSRSAIINSVRGSASNSIADRSWPRLLRRGRETSRRRLLVQKSRFPPLMAHAHRRRWSNPVTGPLGAHLKARGDRHDAFLRTIYPKYDFKKIR